MTDLSPHRSKAMTDIDELIERVQSLIDNALDMDKRSDEVLREVIEALTTLQAKVAELTDYNAKMIDEYQSEIDLLCQSNKSLDTAMAELESVPLPGEVERVLQKVGVIQADLNIKPYARQYLHTTTDMLTQLARENARLKEENSKMNGGRSCKVCGQDYAIAGIAERMGFRPDVGALEIRKLEDEITRLRGRLERLGDGTDLFKHTYPISDYEKYLEDEYYALIEYAKASLKENDDVSP